MQGATIITHRGFSHIGLSTLDLDKTREFYEGVLGFKPVVADTIRVKEGGHLRHIFFDVGHDQLIAFLEPNGVPDVPAKYDPNGLSLEYCCMVRNLTADDATMQERFT